MAFHGSTLMILLAVVLCMEFSPVVPEISAASPLTATGLPPLAVPISASVPAPAGPLKTQPQVTNMIEALRDAGRFGAIAGLLDGLQMKSLTPMTTWLLPNDQAFSGINYPKNVTTFLDYHVIRELLPFSRLLTLSTGTRIPTFLGTETCLVTNNNQFNYSIDNAMVVVPDLYSDSSVVVHGIDAVLDDAAFNGIALPPAFSQSPVPSEAGFRAPTSPSLPITGPFNITFPNAAHALCAAAGLRAIVVSASIIVAALLL